MKTGNFNINDYLEKLYETSESIPKVETAIENKDGMIIPEENKKIFGWLKKEYQQGQTEVKVEMKFTGTNFKPGYDLQTNLNSVKDFKPGMFGEVKTADTENTKPSLDSKKENPNFAKKEGDVKDSEKKIEKDKTNTVNPAIKDKTDSTEPTDKTHNTEKPEKTQNFDKKEDSVKVNKLDLKAKKK